MQNPFRKKRIDTDPQDSSLTGFAGFFERAFRKFKVFVSMLTLVPAYALGALCIALAMTPALFVFNQTSSLAIRFAEYDTNLLPLFFKGLGIGSGFFVFAISLALIVPLFNFILRTKPKPWRGPYYSAHTIPWAFHNGFTYLVRYSVLEFMTPTPLNVLFYRLMGMKIGQNCQINTTNISDPCLIEIGNKVTIGGSVSIIGHYGVGGYLILSPVKIRDGVTIGLRATVMGGVEIGENARILPHSVILPKTIVPAGEVWGGVPAKRIETTSSGSN